MAELLAALANQNDDLYLEMIRENLDRRVLIINDEITENVVEDYMVYILNWNRVDKHIPVEDRVPITLYINSPGGDVFDGEAFCDLIVQSKTPIRAVCLGMAASMAFRIFICCHERIAFKNSVLLMHDGEIAISNSTKKAMDTIKFFQCMEQRTKELVLNHTTMTEDFYDKHYDQEFYCYGNDDAKSLGCVDKVIGEDVDIDYIL